MASNAMHLLWTDCRTHGAAGGPDQVVAALLEGDGLGSSAASERAAALAAVRSLVAAAPEALHPPLATVLTAELDVAAHDQVPPGHLTRHGTNPARS